MTFFVCSINSSVLQMQIPAEGNRAGTVSGLLSITEAPAVFSADPQLSGLLSGVDRAPRFVEIAAALRRSAADLIGSYNIDLRVPCR